MEAKAALFRVMAGKNRGLLANPVEKQAILAAIAQLEDYNPTPQPTASPQQLAGTWRLLYTTSRGILGLAQIPFYQLGRVYQCVDPTNAQIFNVAELFGPPYGEALASVVATFTVLSERRVQVNFQRSIIGLQRWLGYRDPEQFISLVRSGRSFLPLDISLEGRGQQGWLDTTYLDDDLRIGRGSEGSIFVLDKIPGCSP